MTRFVVTGCLVVALGATAALQAGDKVREQKLQQAIDLVESKGDLAKATPLFEEVATSSDRALAARGLLHLAQAQERHGADKTAALLTRQRIVTTFSASSEPAVVAVVEAARKFLPAAPPSQRTIVADPFPAKPIDVRLEFSTSTRSHVSPDGAFALDIRRASQLIERNVATGAERTIIEVPDPQRLASQVRVFVGAPVWSRDGERIAFTVDSRAGSPPRWDLRVHSRRTGDTVVAVTGQDRTNIEALAWTSRGEILYRTVQTAAPQSDAYFMVPATGGEPREVLRTVRRFSKGPDQGTFGDLTPDGTSAIVVRPERLTMVNLASGEERDLTLGIGATAPRVSSDGKLVAYLSNQSSAWALYVAPLDRLPIRNPIRVANLDVVRQDQGWQRPRWTTDGSLYLDFEAGDTNVFRVDMDPKTGRPLGPPEKLTREIGGHSPYVSPDGRRIAYRAWNGGMIVMNADGSGARRLTEPGGPSGTNEPRGWLTNDSVLTVVGSGAEATIKAINTATGAVAPVPRTDGLGPPFTWEYIPARNEIFYRPRRGVIAARSLADGRERTVFTLDTLGAFTLSRDGEWIAYATMAGAGIAGTTQFRARRFADAGIDPPVLFETRTAALPGPSTWHPNGRLFMVETGTDHVVLDVATRQSWSITHPSVTPSFFGPDVQWHWEFRGDWAPDGSFLVGAIDENRRRRLAYQGVTYEAVAKLMRGR